MRALDCACGEHLEAADDEAMAQAVRGHVEQAHPDMQLNDEQIREQVSQQAYDVATTT
jgi:hypothetical protein